jgi:hypothetical protein
MGLKTVSVPFPTCAEYYESNRADQVLLERHRNTPQTSRRCRLLADTERAADAVSHVLGTAAHAQGQHPVTVVSLLLHIERALIWIVPGYVLYSLSVSFPYITPPPLFLLLLHGFFCNSIVPEERDQK